MVTRNQPSNLAQHWDKLRSDYDMSRDSKFVRSRTGLAPQGGSADYHYRHEQNYYRDMEKARDMARNDCIIGQTINRSAVNIVQDGFSLDTKTGDEALDIDLWDRWTEFANDPDLCDIAGEWAFAQYEFHAVMSMLRDGDAVITGTNEGPLQFFEAHTIQSDFHKPSTFLGVELSDVRQPLRYWYSSDPIDQWGITKGTPVPLDVRDDAGNRQLFHVYNPDRMTMTRGVTAIAPIMNMAGMFEDINFAKLVQQQVTSCFTIFRKRQFSPDGSAPPSTIGYGDSRFETTETGGTRQIEDLVPGLEIIGAPGEELQGFSPQIPNSEFFSHVRLMLQIIGVNLGLPLCLVLMDGSETNFSGWRGAVDEARKGFKNNQFNLIRRFHTPVYKWWLRNHVLATDPAVRSAYERGVKVFGHKWHPPSWPYIDPVNDAAGDLLRVRNGLTSHRRLHGERGNDWQEIAMESIEDNGFAIVAAKRKAAAINDQFADDQPVHWRELISLPTPDGITISTSSTQQGMVPAKEGASA